MKCDICKINDAEILFRQHINGKINDMHLCKQCAKSKGLVINSLNGEISLGGLISGLVDSDVKKVCRVCGTNLQSIRRQKRVGCPECYICFKNEIQSLMKTEGIDGLYTGEMPKKLSHFKSVLTDRVILQQRLEQAIANEDYEKAATYRDRLKFLDNTSIDSIDFADPDILNDGGANE